jgi:ABC-type antimicrobial peptide transport system permease subunit
MALGATRESVLKRTRHSALSLTAIGTGIGLVASLGLTRALTSLLFNVKPLDGMVMLCAIVSLFMCSALAA